VTIDPETPDRELIEACRDVQDDRFEAAFEELYRRYRDRVYSIAYRITGSATDAMDVVQESFRVLFLKI
jgi:DNA-directed RNA polymerase specialized sigma24 family protein